MNKIIILMTISIVIVVGSAVTEDSPPYRDTCSSFWHFAVGTSSGTTCT